MASGSDGVHGEGNGWGVIFDRNRKGQLVRPLSPSSYHFGGCVSDGLGDVYAAGSAGVLSLLYFLLKVKPGKTESSITQKQVARNAAKSTRRADRAHLHLPRFLASRRGSSTGENKPTRVAPTAHWRRGNVRQRRERIKLSSQRAKEHFGKMANRRLCPR